MRLDDLVDFPRKFWAAVGLQLCNRIRKRVRRKHKNVEGRRFADYEENYAELKSSGEIRLKGQSIKSRSTIPDMTLSGKTMDNLGVHNFDKKGVELGWLGLQAAIVEDLHGRKNYKIVNLHSDPPFGKSEMRYIDKAINKLLDRNIKKYCAKPINIRKTP